MPKKLKKYYHIIQIIWQQVLMYRAELFLWTFIDATPLLSMIVLWFSVYRSGDSIGGYNLPTIITYYIIGFLISALITAHFEVEGVNDVRSGKVSFSLLKPFSYLKMTILGTIGWKSMSLVMVTIPTLILVSKFLGSYFIPTTPTQFVWVLVYMLIGFIIDILLSVLIICGAFYMEQGRALSHLKWVLQGIFSGSMLPLTAYPQNIQNIAKSLPFQYNFTVPVQAYLQPLALNTHLYYLILGIFWIIVLYLLMKICWRQSIKEFSAVGN